MPRRNTPDSFSLRVGARIRKIRLEVGMSLAELANASQLSKGHLSSVEHGLAAITIHTISRLAEGLGVPPLSLLGREDEAPYLANVPLVHKKSNTKRNTQPLLALDGNLSSSGSGNITEIALRPSGSKSVPRRTPQPITQQPVEPCIADEAVSPASLNAIGIIFDRIHVLATELNNAIADRTTRIEHTNRSLLAFDWPSTIRDEQTSFQEIGAPETDTETTLLEK